MIISLLWRAGKGLTAARKALEIYPNAQVIVNLTRISDRDAVEGVIELAKKYPDANIVVKEVSEESLLNALVSVVQLYKTGEIVIIDPNCCIESCIERLLNCGGDAILAGSNGCKPHLSVDDRGFVTHVGADGNLMFRGGIKFTEESSRKILDILIKTYDVERAGLNVIINIYIAKYGYLKACLIP